MSKNSLKAAAVAAARVNAMLIAKGKLKMPDSKMKSKNQSPHTIIGDRTLDNLITAEFDINDVPVPARNLLTRGLVQDEICKYSGASISTRGRYLSYEEKLSNTSNDRPLYLHIQGSSKEAVNLAMVRIQEMIAQFDKSNKLTSDFGDTSFGPPPISYNSVMPPTVSQPSSGGHFVQDKVFVGLESSYPAFSVRERILGPAGSFLQHIKTESGANVTLRGRGSGFFEPTSGQEAFEPLYIHLTHPKPEGLQAAKTLALNLIDTVHAEYSLFQQQSQQALMPITMSPSSIIQYQNLMPVASNGQILINNSQDMYTSSAGLNYGFQTSYVNTIPGVNQNTVTTYSLNPGPIPYMPLSFGAQGESMNPGMEMVSQPMITMAPPPMVQPSSHYRDLAPQASMMVSPNYTGATSMAQQMMPTAYTHLYMKQQQQAAIIQQQQQQQQQHQSMQHKRKFREEDPGPNMQQNPGPLPQITSYCLQAGSTREEAIFNGNERLHLPPKQQGICRGADRNLMPPPPPGRMTSMVGGHRDNNMKQETSVTNRRPNHEGDRKKFKGALRGIAAFYNSDDSE